MDSASVRREPGALLLPLLFDLLFLFRTRKFLHYNMSWSIIFNIQRSEKVVLLSTLRCAVSDSRVKAFWEPERGLILRNLTLIEAE